MTSPSYITVRKVPPPTTRALKVEARRRGVSVNQLVKDLLAEALHLKSGTRRENGLRKYSGTWSEAELAEFKQNTEQFETIDSELWR